MDKIIKAKDNLINPLSGTSEWYWNITGYSAGSISRMAEFYQSVDGPFDNQLYFIHYPSGRSIEPIKSKGGQYFLDAIYETGFIYFTLMDFEVEVFELYQLNPQTEKVAKIANLPWSEVKEKECVNLASSPLMLVEGWGENFQILWPEKKAFHVKNGSFSHRKNNHLYFNTLSNITPEYVICDYETGQILDRQNGELHIMPNGEIWVIQGVTLYDESFMTSDEIASVTASCGEQADTSIFQGEIDKHLACKEADILPLEGSSHWFYKNVGGFAGILERFEEDFRLTKECHGNYLYFIHYPSGRYLEPLAPKDEQYFMDPLYVEGNIYIPLVNFHDQMIRILSLDPETEEVVQVGEIPLSAVKGGFIPRLIAYPLALVEISETNTFDMYWPEPKTFQIRDMNFSHRRANLLYFDGASIDGVASYSVIDYDTGKEVELGKGWFQKMPNGEIWLLE